MTAAAHCPASRSVRRRPGICSAPEGVQLDLGSGMHRYLAFERSGSMSRQSKLSFLRTDVYDQVRRRIQMDMTIGDCQLSKLYAYNGLMLSSGTRLDGIDIDKPHRVIVVDNPVVMTRGVPVVTVKTTAPRTAPGSITGWSAGWTFPSPAMTEKDSSPSSTPRSSTGRSAALSSTLPFRSVLPYIKGMVHQVDFQEILDLCGQTVIRDSWGRSTMSRTWTSFSTKSMFKGFGWLKTTLR